MKFIFRVSGRLEWSTEDVVKLKTRVSQLESSDVVGLDDCDPQKVVEDVQHCIRNPRGDGVSVLLSYCERNCADN